MQSDLYRRTWFELQYLETEYWYDIDMKWGRSGHTFYVEDGVFAIADRQYKGRDEIERFYRWRESLGDRVARHVVANPRVTEVSEERARFECILLLYAENGVPVLESKPAIMIADVVNDYVNVDGAWKLQSRMIRPIFEGGAIPTVPTGGLPAIK